jgi:hypothetical protein
MFWMKRLALTAACVGAASLAACRDTLSPDTVSPEQLGSKLETLASTFDNNIAFQSLKTLSTTFPQFSVVAALRAGTPQGMLPAAMERAIAVQMGAARALAGVRGRAGTEALFPADVLGKTLVWSTDSSRYVVGQQAGGPANGIRILLYAVNPVTLEPVQPLQQLGYLDLTDESTAQANKLGVVLTLGTSTIASYSVQTVRNTYSVTLTSTGYIKSADGTQQVDFTISSSFRSQSGVGTFVYDLRGSDGTVVHLVVAGTSGNGNILFRISSGHNRIELSFDVSGATATGIILFNGFLVATLDDSGNGVQVSASGYNLTPAQITALVAIFGHVATFLGDFADGILGPVAVVPLL